MKSKYQKISFTNFGAKKLELRKIKQLRIEQKKNTCVKLFKISHHSNTKVEIVLFDEKPSMRQFFYPLIAFYKIHQFVRKYNRVMKHYSTLYYTQDYKF